MSGKPAHFIAGRWVKGTGMPMVSTDPATGQQNWSGIAAGVAEVDQAVRAARDAFPGWADTPLASRIEVLNAIASGYEQRKRDLASAISRETGKPRWEALTEVEAMITKVPISIEAYQARCASNSAVASGVTAATRYKPQGVVAVLGPFNMPGHLPNGHLIPAMLAGNATVFKPSEQTPLVGELIAEIIHGATLPEGVFNLVQGAAETGQALAAHDGIDGLFFTGSAAVGVALSKALADQPNKILALEMGGNNPLVFHDCSDLDAAAYATIQSAYITSGQRCSCARRLIVTQSAAGEKFVECLMKWIKRIRIGVHDDLPEPFMGPVINATSASRLLNAQGQMSWLGGQVLVEMRPDDRSTALLSPGLIDVTVVATRPDTELFGPLLQLIRVPDFDAAITEANRTRYGLSAGLLSDSRQHYDRFFREIRAGIVNWNRALTGASSRLPFGGVGRSGNHRPSAYFATDYCSYPVAAMEIDALALPAQLTPGFS